MTYVELRRFASDCDNRIEDLKKRLAEEEDRKKKILKKLEETSEGAMKNDTVIGKYYYHPKSGALYHPQVYGTEFSAFDWETAIIYKGLFFIYHNQGTMGVVYSFNFQYSMSKRFLEDDCEEISKEEFIEKTKEVMDGILEFETSDIYLDGDGSTYEEIKPNKNRI